MAAELVDDLTSHVRAEMTALPQSVAAKDEVIGKLQDEISYLKDENDRLEQYSRRNSLRISGVPEIPNEEVMQCVLDICRHKLGVPVSREHIERAHCTGKKIEGKASPRPILVKFSSYGPRDAVFKAKSVLRPGGRHPDQPWTLGVAAGLAPTTMPANDLTIPHDSESERPVQPDNEPRQPASSEGESPTIIDNMDFSKVFISEDLTRNRQYLLWRARLAKKNKKLNDCWSHDGQIIIKDSNNKIVPIMSVKQLDDIDPTTETTV